MNRAWQNKVSTAQRDMNEPCIQIHPLRRVFIGVSIVLLVGGVALYFKALQPSFDADVWKSVQGLQDEDAVATRFSMAEALLRSGQLHGMERSELLNILGPPPPPEYFKGQTLVYYLGDERGWMSIDSEWLVITLDADGKASQWAIRSD